ncbi:hypothetical protein MTP99_013243 [Tenebrio molitor]|nr:hypothetical protein MTP99_013243 [Tenebrio molitor]
MFYLLFLSTLVVLTHSTPLKDEPSCGYSSCPEAGLDTLNVHLIPHSHDDLGWLKTMDKYYFQDVQNVIGSVVGALKQNPDRRFVQVETAYFKEWWDRQNDIVRQDVIDLVNNGQLEIINGGWCMNDEANTNYQSTIDQYTLGLRFLEDTLGPCGRPRVGWQIDTFGHSREQASISAKLGFDSLFFMRMDYRDKNKRLEDKTGDLLWKGSQNLNDSYIFTSIFYGAYSFPEGFCFDIVCQDEPIIDDEESPDYNYDRRVDEFAEFVSGQASQYPTNNILVVMGDDVRYQASLTNFLNIDRLIKGFELFPKTFDDKPIKLLYSTPSCYAKAVNEFVTANDYNLDIKTDDFLPYATDGYGYWSGFYTSRPSKKRFERQGNNFLQIAKQLSAITNQPYESRITRLKEAVAVIQHHDAITGTEKEDVMKDYVRMLDTALEEANQAVDPILSTLIGSTSDDSFKFNTCLLANISSCGPSKSDKFTVTVYNPLSRPVSSPIELPVDSQTLMIEDPQGNEVIYQTDPTIIDFSYAEDVPISPYTLLFTAEDLPPLGFKVYTFTKAETAPEEQPHLTVGNDNTSFEIDDDTGLLKSITMNGVTMDVSQDLAYYRSGSYSGAYIFVPLENEKHRVTEDKVKTTPISGDIYQGVLQEFNSWAKQIIKVYNDDSNYIEIDWIIGPVDVSDGIGREVVSVFTTPLQTEGNFYTDSNGREMLKRTRNYRPTFDYTNEEPIAGNYHPITSRIVLKDEEQGLELAILNDRAQGGASLEDGQVEIMIQRACTHNDRSQGNVRDSINDQEYGQGVIIRGKHYLILGPSSGNGEKSLAAIQRDVAQKKLLAPWAFVTDQDITQQLDTREFSSLKTPLSDNVHILTLEPWNENTLLLRLEHIMEKDEDENLSQETTVDLSDLFATFTITELEETTLGANIPLEDSVRLSWPGTGDTEDGKNLDGLKVTLAPMQIRTFLAKITSTL